MFFTRYYLLASWNNLWFRNYFILFVKYTLLTNQITCTMKTPIKTSQNRKAQKWTPRYPVLELLSYFSCYSLFGKHNFEMVTKQRRNDVTPSQGFLKDFPKVLVIPCWLLLESNYFKIKSWKRKLWVLSKPAVFSRLAKHKCLRKLKMNFRKI